MVRKRRLALSASVLSLVVGIPGMLEGISVWRKWFGTTGDQEWLWWNHALVNLAVVLDISALKPERVHVLLNHFSANSPVLHTPNARVTAHKQVIVVV